MAFSHIKVRHSQIIVGPLFLLLSAVAQFCVPPSSPTKKSLSTSVNNRNFSPEVYYIYLRKYTVFYQQTYVIFPRIFTTLYCFKLLINNGLKHS